MSLHASLDRRTSQVIRHLRMFIRRVVNLISVYWCSCVGMQELNVAFIHSCDLHPFSGISVVDNVPIEGEDSTPEPAQLPLKSAKPLVSHCR